LASIRSLRSEGIGRALDVTPESQFLGESAVEIAVATIAGTATAVPPYLLTRDIVMSYVKLHDPITAGLVDSGRPRVRVIGTPLRAQAE